VDESGNEGTYTAQAKDVAARYGVSRAHVYNLVDRGEIPHRKIGTAIRFNMDEVAAWMKAHSDVPAPAETAS
jgi:excisionase family DNA binding protein